MRHFVLVVAMSLSMMGYAQEILRHNALMEIKHQGVCNYSSMMEMKHQNLRNPNSTMEMKQNEREAWYLQVRPTETTAVRGFDWKNQETGIPGAPQRPVLPQKSVSLFDGEDWWDPDTIFVFSVDGPTERAIYSYGNSNCTTELRQQWNETQWENVWKDNWAYDAQNNMIEELYYTWESGQWVNEWKNTHTYDIYNNLIATLSQSRDWETGELVNSWNETFIYDTQNNCIEHKSQHWISGQWVNGFIYTYTYDERNNMIEEISQNTDWETGEVEYVAKSTYSYDERNNMIEEISQATDWGDPGQLRNRGKLNCRYDEQNNMTGFSHQYWESEQWMNELRRVFSYDTQNNCIEDYEQSWKQEQWVNDWKVNGAYDAQNNLIERVEQSGYFEQWVNDWKETFFYDAQNNLTEFLVQIWGSGQWVNQTKTIFIYDAHNNLTEDITLFWESEQWVNESKRSCIFDENNNGIVGFFQRWTDSEWQDDNGSVAIYYNNMKEEIYFGGGPFTKIHRVEVSYVKTTTTAIEENVSDENFIKIYPNPTSGELKITYYRHCGLDPQSPENDEIAGQARNDIHSVEVFDVMGRTVGTTLAVAPDGTHRLQIGTNAPPGIYFIRITTANGTVTRKVVKQ